MKQVGSESQPFIPGLLLLAALCLYGLLRMPFTAAESALLARAQAPVAELIGSSYSPFYLLLLRLWSSLGEHPFWLRLLPALCGLAALPVGQRLVRGLGGTHATPGALLLLGGAPLLVVRASQLSPASLGLVALLLCFVCFVELARGEGWIWLAGWLLAALVACGIHVSCVWALGIQWIVALAYRSRYRLRPLLWWPAQLLLAALVAGWYHQPIQQYLALRAPALLQALRPVDGVALIARLSTGLTLPAGLFGALLLGLIMLAGLWTCGSWRRDARHGLLILCLVVPCLVWLAGARADAHLLMALVCWCTLVAMGLRQFPRWGRQALWFGVAVIYLWSYWHLLG